jgi:uncharacterized protein (DUF433 family)
MITPHRPNTNADQIEVDMIDWSGCPDVERIPGKVSGQWIVVGTRILADGVVENVDAGVSLEELVTEVYPGLGLDRARRILAYARQHAPRPA